MSAEQQRAYECIFCLTGREQAVAERIQYACSEVRATAAMQEKYKSDNGKKSKVQTVMLPGYVFFEAPDDVNAITHFPRTDVLRILMGNDQDWRLTGNDYEFAKWLFSYEGGIRFSTAYREGDRIRILSGSLKDIEGMISRIDKRGRSGQITVRFNQRDVTLWLGFDLIKKCFYVKQ